MIKSAKAELCSFDSILLLLVSIPHTKLGLHINTVFEKVTQRSILNLFAL